MRDVRKLGGFTAALLVLSLLPAFPALAGAAPQSSELWGGPGAKGGGLYGATFDTTIYVGADDVAANIFVDFFQAGGLAATASASIGAHGVIALHAPADIADLGPFFYRIRSNAPVTAWSETYNITASGQYGLSVDAFLFADFLATGDEATGAGAEAVVSSTEGSRTNVGMFCTPGSITPCRLEVSAYGSGALLGMGLIDAVPASAVQRNLADLIPAAAGHTLISLRMRVLEGQGAPYAVKNHNETSDAARIPLTANRSAFSTAPVVTAFTASPSTGCSPQKVNLEWATTGAVRVTITGVSGDLPPSGSTTTTLLTSTDLVLTAFAPSGQTTSVPRHVTVIQPPQPPTPSPASGTIIFGGTIEGLLPSVNGITAQFVKHESTGSTFVIKGSTYVYTAGSTAGTDIVRLTLASACGPITADFTATVVAPGSPEIVSFTADPMTGCAPANIVLTWVTNNVAYVELTGVNFILNSSGSYGVTLDATTTFTLTAHGLAGGTVTADLTVPVAPGVETPILTPSVLNVASFGSATFTVTGVDDPSHLPYLRIKYESGGYLQQDGHGNFTYYAGGPGQDIFRILYTNGCGTAYADLTVNVSP